ncbi:hypothetical protein PLICRDRAFT_698570 [Plicaturopsis crispa FD-325 SS-3]|nr:hypothetical protein PLICRDRAFT_698570 [Plicaturopsis crispa FD-325 SS-3]
MYDQTYEEMARECGLDDDDLAQDQFVDSGVGFLGQNSYDLEEQFAQYMDGIDSSPSPQERRVASQRQFAQQPQYVATTSAQEYEDDSEYYEPPSNQHRYNDSNSYSSESVLGPWATSEPDIFGQASASRNVPVPQHTSHIEYDPRFENNDTRPNYQSQSNNFAGQTARENNSRRGEDPRNAHRLRLRPVSELPDIYRGIFNFGVFNAVQSTCFDTVVGSNENLVVSAPTGSGKTVLFELSIVRMLTEASSSGRSVKCVYVAPTKALCTERFRDWTTKFGSLGIKCCELTGDTVTFGKGAWGDAKNSSIIITTGEKWDSLTRNWRENEHILSQIQLFLVDEVHILNEPRGSTLEVVVARMKARGVKVRFVLVSATVPNIGDIAAWIGSAGTNTRAPGDAKGRDARVFEFGEEFRPCKLTRAVYGVHRHRDQNDFAFIKSLDRRLFPVLQQHSVNKPMLIFCATRSGCVGTAQQLAKDYEEARQTKGALPWHQPTRIDQRFTDPKLAELAALGIGVHHAGLSLDDKRLTEDLFMKKVLRVVVCTSTLAVGVNLPAYMVVIKGVKNFFGGEMSEYSDLDIMQMMGRAGRPQFDKEGVAIILCEAELEGKYKALTHGKTILESTLHHTLSEHLNSEIGLGTITSLASAKTWLRESFLFQRIQKNPGHYAMGREEGQTWEERVDGLVLDSVGRLREAELVEFAGVDEEGEGELGSTEYGDIMSKFYLKQGTMNLILKLSDRPSVREILEMISSAEELAQSKIRAGEKTAFNKLRQHNDIRFQIKKVERPCDKVFLLIQAILGGISLNVPEYRSSDSQPHLEVFNVFRHVPRIARAVVEVGIVKKSGAQTKHGLELVRCLTARAWEDRPVVMRQIEQIGEKSLKVLAEAGIVSFPTLRKQNAHRIETLLNRKSPFGLEILASTTNFPQYSLKIDKLDVSSSGGQGPVEVELSIECTLKVDNPPGWKAKKVKKGTDMTSVLTLTSDLDYIDFRRIPTKSLKEPKTFEVVASLVKPSQSVVVLISSESIAGVLVTETFKPKVDAKEYPTMDTRPKNSVDMDLEGLEDDPDFWNMAVDDDEENDDEPIPIKDLTKGNQNATKSTASRALSTKTSAGSVLKTVDAKVAPPVKLPNGNYPCNHACKDKTVCRHMCCRDGLLEPPHAPKKSVSQKEQKTHETNTPARNEKGSKNEKKRSATKVKKENRQDPRLEQLETLHKATNVEASIGLTNGRRLKLDSSLSAQKPGKFVPNFDMELSGPTGDFQPSTKILDDLHDSDDDLPEPYEISTYSAAARNRSSEGEYSNSEMDALIRDAPADIDADDDDDVQVVETSTRDPSTTTKKRKLTSDDSEIKTAPTKRPRDQPSIQSSRARSASYTKESIPPKKEALFLPSSPDQDTETRWSPSDRNPPQDLSSSHLPAPEYIEFELDADMFDTVASPESTFPTTTPVPKNATSIQTSARYNVPSAVAQPAPAIPEPPSSTQDNAADYYEDDFAELEAFLRSDAVIIVDKLP